MRISILGLATLVSVAAPLSTASAAPGNIRIGTMGAIWCNYKAKIHLDTRQGGEWIFEGRIHIEQTGQVDRVWVKQYEDNSLRIVRYLSGEYAGRRQIVETHAPERYSEGGRYVQRWKKSASSGPGCGRDSMSNFVMTE